MISGLAKKITKNKPFEVAFRIAKTTEVVQVYGGTMTAEEGDYIIEGMTPYVYNEDTFNKLYEVIEEKQ